MDSDGFSGVYESDNSGKIRVGRSQPIIGNQGLHMICICGGGMEKHMTLRVTQSPNLTLKPHTHVIKIQLSRLISSK